MFLGKKMYTLGGVLGGIHSRTCLHDDFSDKSTLNYEEFRSLMIPIIEKAMREMRKGFEEAFREFDKDGNGKVDKDEFR